ncbi:hypothetical protein HK102_008770 [Quaeritorhiza haematococci]|nr:hypothetical protein HK102_008770 [Quaeritorhiza haematococci]
MKLRHAQLGCFIASIACLSYQLPGVQAVPQQQPAGKNKAPVDDNVARGQGFCQARFPQLALSDGTQNKGGACSLTVQGAIPSFDKMVSSVITEPKNGASIPAAAPFQITVRVNNMNLGAFDNPQTAYYRTPQTLDKTGRIIGHTHVVMQLMPNENPDQPLDARNFAFFRGLDFRPKDGNTLSITVPADKTPLKTGPYRICSMAGSRAHQPVVMPVAQRGSQDDCIRINVVDGGAPPPPNKNKDVPPPPPPADNKNKNKNVAPDQAAQQERIRQEQQQRQQAAAAAREAARQEAIRAREQQIRAAQEAAARAGVKVGAPKRMLRRW